MFRKKLLKHKKLISVLIKQVQKKATDKSAAFY